LHRRRDRAGQQRRDQDPGGGYRDRRLTRRCGFAPPAKAGRARCCQDGCRA
jgi:hypothetical protein